MVRKTSTKKIPPVPGLVRIHLLGRFRIELDGDSLKSAGKSRRKPLELLKVLVALGGDGVSVVSLTESLWPDAEGDHAYGSFTTTLSRLRDLIGQKSILLQDGRLSLDGERCWVDVQAFPEKLKAASRAVEDGEPEAAERLMDEALVLYRGPFLEGEFEPPEILSARERLHGIFLRHIEQMAEFLVESGRGEQAVRLYRKGLEIDDLAENFYQNLMRCHLKEGRFAEGAGVYRRCRHIFEATLGITPAPETEAVYRELLEVRKKQEAESAPPVEPAEPASLPDAPAASSTPVVSASDPLSAPPPGGGEELEFGERRMVTIASHLLTGFNDLHNHLDPEAVEELLHRIRGEILPIVEKHGGFVNHIIRDEAVVIYGLPVAHEDDPRRAVQGSLELHKRMRHFQPLLKSRYGQELGAQSGIDTGRILASPHSERDGRFGITGDAVNRAAQLARGAKRGEILLGAETQRQVESYFSTVPVSPEAGQDGPACHRVVRQTAITSRFEESRQRGLTPHIGREEEMATLRATLESSRAGEGQFVFIIGEAGLGKSRLIHEFGQHQGPKPMETLQANCHPDGSNTPYGPFLQLLRRGLRLREGDTPGRMRKKLERNLRALDPSLEGYLPYYFSLLSIRSKNHPLPRGMEGEELRARIMDALVAILTVTLQQRPMMIVLEDLHWADEATLTALQALSSVVARYSLLFIVTYRPDLTLNWGHQGHHSHLELKPLGLEKVRHMLHRLLDAESLPDGLAERIHEHTEGNPFFIEELIRALIEDRDLTSDGKNPRLAHPVEQLTIPDTVQAVISARLDRLEPEALKVLRLAAVIGQEFPAGLLNWAYPAGSDTGPMLERLREKEMIHQIQVFPEVLYRFNHNIIQRVVYQTLMVQQRKMLHQRIAQVVEELYADRLEEHFEALAHHHGHGVNPEKALLYLEQAAQKATHYFSLKEARRHYRRAVELLDTLEPTAERRLARIDLTIKYGMVSFYSPSRELLAEIQRAHGEARAIKDPTRVASTTFLVGMISYALGNLPEGLERFNQCLAMPEVQKNALMLALATTYKGRIHVYFTEFSEGAACLKESIPLLEKTEKDNEAANSKALLSIMMGLQGKFDGGLALTREVIEWGDANGNPALTAIGEVCRGIVAGIWGHWEEAREASANATNLSRSISNPVAEGMGVWGEGFPSAMLGDPERGISLMEEGIGIIESTGSNLNLSAYNSELSRIYALEGRLEEARATVDKVRRLIDTGADRMGELVISCTEAIIALQENPEDADAVMGHMKKVLRVCKARNAPPYQAINHFYYAHLLCQLKLMAKAGEQLNLGEALFRKLGMEWWMGKSAGLREKIGAS